MVKWGVSIKLKLLQKKPNKEWRFEKQREKVQTNCLLSCVVDLFLALKCVSGTTHLQCVSTFTFPLDKENNFP